MIDFHEYVARRQKAALPSPERLLALLGIDPHGPHEIDVLMMVKDEKKRSAQAPPTTSPGIFSPSGRKGMPPAATTAR